MRNCDNCSLCCKLLEVEINGVKKPNYKWCDHCVNFSRCGIYETRPDVCRAFTCLWIIDPGFPEFMKPTTCKMVCMNNVTKDKNGIDIVTKGITVFVDNGINWQKKKQVKKFLFSLAKQMPVFLQDESKKRVILK